MVAALIAYIDTHVAVWLAEGLTRKLSAPARQAIDRYSLLLSPMVVVEMEYQHELQRCRLNAVHATAKLLAELGVTICEYPFAKVAYAALHEKWTRDAFDRVIVAHARANASAPLITADEHIREHYAQSVW